MLFRSAPIPLPLSACPLALAFAFACALADPNEARGHDSPEHVAQVLTDRMRIEGVSVPLLLQRAREYRAAGLLDHADQDLAAAITLQPGNWGIVQELADLKLALRAPAEALSALERAEKLSPDSGRGETPLMLKAEALRRLGRLNEALSACDQAGASAHGSLDLALFRSGLLAELGRHSDRVKFLQTARRTSESAVLRSEWIEALLDAGEFDLAQPEIDAEIEQCRWRSSWLIRRARVRLGHRQLAQARDDLHAAIEEINQRLRPERPDLTLLVDRGLAWAWLGDRGKASTDFAAAASLGADDWLLAPLRRVLHRTNPAAVEKAEPQVQSRRLD